VGLEVPALAFPSASGGLVDIGDLARGTLVLYVYPRTGTPGQPLIEGWDDIPGARGCTPHNCAFRDHAADLNGLGARVHGLSAQPLEEQRQFVRRERIPYPLLNDAELRLAGGLGLPTFEAGGMTLYRRVTLVARAGRVEHVLYPVFPPGSDALEVSAWLRENPEP
jgi:peroxiredoxin